MRPIGLLHSDSKKLEILQFISDGKWYSFYAVHTGLRMNYITTKKQLRFLEVLKLVEVISIPKEESATGKAMRRVRITQDGKKLLDSLLME
ncbi:MAG: hypothetical protein V3V21_08205 [Thermoplasmata archaeon]